jgi:F-type H+-transporting ATPase subunit delta
MRYAQALYAYALDQNAVESIAAEANSMLQALVGSAELQTMVGNPLLKTSSLAQVFETISQHFHLNDGLRRFIHVIVGNRRGAILSQILQSFHTVVAQRQGIVQGTISAAHPLNDGQKSHLMQKLGAMGYDAQKLRLRFDVDPSLLGGLVIQIGAYQYDTSLKSRLQRLQLAMKEAA